MSSLPVPSPEQRIQQLESAVVSLISQVAELTRELQSAREELGLEVAEVIETYEAVTQHHNQRLIRLEHMVDDGDSQDEEQYDDSG